MSTEHRLAIVTDLDDTVTPREGYTRIGGAIKGRLRPHHLPDLSIRDITKLELYHFRVNTPVKKWKEKISLAFHARRQVDPRVREEFEACIENEEDIYVATGRSNKSTWVDVTERTLQQGGIRDLIKEVYYTPKGARTAVSKAHVLYIVTQSYDQVRFDEDDPWTIQFIAPLFPDVQINYIWHRATALSLPKGMMDQYPNVREVRSRGRREGMRTPYLTRL